MLTVPGQYRTIQGAIDAVRRPGTKIRVCPGLYRENLELRGLHVEIVGLGGREGVVIEGSSRNRNTVYFSKGSPPDGENHDSDWDSEEELPSAEQRPAMPYESPTARLVGVTIVHLGTQDDRHHYGAVSLDAGSLIIQDCSLNSLGGAGVYVKGANTSCRIVDSYIHGCLQSGVLCSQGARLVMEKSQLSENYLDGLCSQSWVSSERKQASVLLV